MLEEGTNMEREEAAEKLLLLLMWTLKREAYAW